MPGVQVALESLIVGKGCEIYWKEGTRDKMEKVNKKVRLYCKEGEK